jgi:hypothetical protein
MDMVICCLAGEIQNIMQVLEITHLHIPGKTCRLAALQSGAGNCESSMLVFLARSIFVCTAIVPAVVAFLFY